MRHDQKEPHPTVPAILTILYVISFHFVDPVNVSSIALSEKTNGNFHDVIDIIYNGKTTTESLLEHHSTGIQDTP